MPTADAQNIGVYEHVRQITLTSPLHNFVKFALHMKLRVFRLGLFQLNRNFLSSVNIDG